MADIMSMSSQEETLRYVFHIVVPNKKGDCVIGEVMPNGDLRLPRMDLPTDIEYPCFEKEDKIEGCIEAHLGICGYMTASLWNGYNTRIKGDEEMEDHDLVLLEIIDDQAALQKPLQWICWNSACNSKWVPTNGEENEEHVNEILENMFMIINGEKEEKLGVEPWEAIGWYEELMSWTHKVLESRNMVMEGRIRQIQRRDTSIVLSCEVKMGQSMEEIGCKKECDVMFIKASVPSIGEVQRTAAIRNVIGNIVPEIIGIDETEAIMIQRNGGKVTDAPWDPEGFIKTILRMQSLSMNRIDELEAGGVLLADSQWAESHVECILNHELLDECWKLTGGEQEKQMKKRIVDGLRSRVSLVQEDCRKITSLGLPNTIVHGDLHAFNIGSPLKQEGNIYRLFDWTESFIGNPLHDFRRVLNWICDDFPGDDASYEAALKQVYERWKPCASVEEMEDLFPLLLTISDIVTVFQHIEQYDACGELEADRRALVVCSLQRMMELLQIFML